MANRQGRVSVVRGRDLHFLPASHEDPLDPGVLKKILFKRAGLPEGRVQMINWAVMPEGKSFRPHYHEDMDEIFILVTGKASVTAGKHSILLEEGDAILIPGQTVHAMVNAGPGEVRYLVVGISRGANGRTVTAERLTG